ncbi:MAG: hypothetical protein JW734_01290 [Candidatus Omnitrophica bacterium]|nr:hypothetical protein [Candidatus Omnitrophota bacterium]
MKELVILVSFVLLIGFAISGCAGLNQGLDKANEGAREVGKPVGKVMSIPGSVAEGAAEGIITEENEDNPFNR